MSSPSPEFAMLVNKLLDETISAEEHQRLMEYLRGNPDAIKDYLFSIDVHSSIKELEGKSEDEAVTAVNRPLRNAHSSVVFRRGAVGKRSWAFGGIAALTGTIALLLVSLKWIPGFAPNAVPDQVSAVARNEVFPAPGDSDSALPLEAAAKVEPATKKSPVVLTQVAQVELFLEKTPEIGAEIDLGREFVLSKGLMELTFDNGATAVMQAPAIFVVAGPTRIEMKMGRCSVHAPESAVGFEVVTPQGRVVDLGTRFSVVAKEVGVSDVQVIEGAVRFHPPEAEAREDIGSMLLEGEAIRIPDAAQKSEAIPFNRHEYKNKFPDRVVSYTADPAPGGRGVRDLTGVTVQRGGSIQTYSVDDLIGVKVLHFSAYSKLNSTCSEDSHPRGADLLLGESVALTEGITNFDRSPEPYRPASEFRNFRDRHGLAVQFDLPVKNQPGPDVVLFELQSAAYPTGGDQIYISPIEDQPGLKTHHLKQFDITMHSSNALEVAPVMTHLFSKPPRSLDDLLNATIVRSSLLHVPFYALAVGIDLSDLGYEANASVPGIFIEDADDDDFVAIDVVFIRGLP